jgi:hypothetical protein
MCVPHSIASHCIMSCHQWLAFQQPDVIYHVVGGVMFSRHPEPSTPSFSRLIPVYFRVCNPLSLWAVANLALPRFSLTLTS